MTPITVPLTEAEKQAYIYSKTAAKFIFHRQDILNVQVWANGAVWVRFSKGSRLCSKSAFKFYFAESRRQRANGLLITANPYDKTRFTARSQRDPNKIYNLTAHPDRIVCNCPDHEMQCLIGIGRATCKHAYALLNHLGCDSLQSYIEKTVYSVVEIGF
jgi:hypothetical protein